MKTTEYLPKNKGGGVPLRTKNEHNNIKRGEKRKVSSISAFFEEKQQISKAIPPRPNPNAPFKRLKPPPKANPPEKQNSQEKQQHHPTKQETQQDPQTKQQTQQGARPKTKIQQPEHNIINNKHILETTIFHIFKMCCTIFKILGFFLDFFPL